MNLERAIGIYCKFLLENKDEDAFMLTPEFEQARKLLREYDSGFERNLGALVFNYFNPNKIVDVSISNKS